MNPEITANLAALGNKDSQSVTMRISGFGLVPATYHPETNHGPVKVIVIQTALLRVLALQIFFCVIFSKGSVKILTDQFMELRPGKGVVKGGDRSGRCPSGDERLFCPIFCRRRGLRTQGGFSLIELLLVSAVMALMAALLYSALSGFSSSAGRRGAVNVLMNTLDHARIAALESSQTVYVGFADDDFPIEEMRYASFLVFRETSEEERASGAGSYFVLKKWTKLPRNVAFKRVAGSLVAGSGGQTFPGLNAALPAGLQDETFPSLAFNGSGAVDGGSNPIQLFLYEGYYDGRQDIQTRKAGDLFEKISLSRYTGRAHFDVTASKVQ